VNTEQVAAVWDEMWEEIADTIKYGEANMPGGTTEMNRKDVPTRKEDGQIEVESTLLATRVTELREHIDKLYDALEPILAGAPDPVDEQDSSMGTMLCQRAHFLRDQREQVQEMVFLIERILNESQL